jgi:hypothetical protein
MPNANTSLRTIYRASSPDVGGLPSQPDAIPGTATRSSEESDRLSELQIEEGQGEFEPSRVESSDEPVHRDLQDQPQCDEKRPVCDKCAIHYAHIQKCDYGDESPSSQESMTKKPAAEKLRRALKAVPILPKSRHRQEVGFSTLARPASSNWDPFKQHPHSVEPDIHLLMGSCQFMPAMRRV